MLPSVIISLLTIDTLLMVAHKLSGTDTRCSVKSKAKNLQFAGRINDHKISRIRQYSVIICGRLFVADSSGNHQGFCKLSLNHSADRLLSNGVEWGAGAGGLIVAKILRTDDDAFSFEPKLLFSSSAVATLSPSSSSLSPSEFVQS